MQQAGNIEEAAQLLRRDEAELSSSCALSDDERFKTNEVVSSSHRPGGKTGGLAPLEALEGEQPWHGYPRGGTPGLLGAAANRRCS